MPGVLNKAGVVGVGLGLKQIPGEVGVVVGLVAGLLAHADEGGGEVAAAIGGGDGLVGGGDVEGVFA